MGGDWNGNRKGDWNVPLHGASQHFTNTKEDFIDFEIVKNAPKVKTASHTVLQVAGQGAILLSHYVNIRGAQVVKTTRIYPVMYIPGVGANLVCLGLPEVK